MYSVKSPFVFPHTSQHAPAFSPFTPTHPTTHTFTMSAVTLQVPTVDLVKCASLPPVVRVSSVHFNSLPTRSKSSAAGGRKILHSPPPKSKAKPVRVFSSEGKKSGATLKDKIAVVKGTGRRSDLDWVPIPGFKPVEYTLLPVAVARGRADISHRAFPKTAL
ncbi:hypothetical protein SCP_1303320 [Sparassis crispa]|uniref:Uncharacterized protein n=1 Tax=Sparassis crispa TaxID=139825 RepID=A0A401H238_9APHY|nr:hypothetical protein SCP_1303320 [Sparassis crispa]GBE88516.1 hypothetical protein SCP_1303320 [Sparassis crispa]